MACLSTSGRCKTASCDYLLSVYYTTIGQPNGELVKSKSVVDSASQTLSLHTAGKLIVEHFDPLFQRLTTTIV